MADVTSEEIKNGPLGQEEYISNTPFWTIVFRGIKKVVIEMTSIKTIFLTFICVAAWCDKVSDMWFIVGGLATLGVKELPSNIFETVINRFGGK